MPITIRIPVLGWRPDDVTNANYVDGRHIHYEMVETFTPGQLKADYIHYEALSNSYKGIIARQGLEIPITRGLDGFYIDMGSELNIKVVV